MPVKGKNEIKNHMRTLRKSRKINVKKMAKDLGIGASTIYDLEAEEKDNLPSLTHAYLIANYFNLPVYMVFEPVGLKIA